MTFHSPSRDIVLVVDDSPESLSMLTDALDEAGFMVLVALEGAKALELVSRITPDVVLMDAVMPGMDGFETCAQLKHRSVLEHVPVIFMTGLSETEHIVKGFASGGVDYVSKPLEPAEVIARIRVHLANARMAQSARAALDAAGRFLLATDTEGRLRWATPQARRLIQKVLPTTDDGTFELPAHVRSWIAARAKGGTAAGSAGQDAGAVISKDDEAALRVSYVAAVGDDEVLLRLVDTTANEEEILSERLSLTLREAEVLKWVGQGKSNRDIGEILDLSPRTINKHLEQIYTKLGVENRTSAAAIAIRTLGDA